MKVGDTFFIEGVEYSIKNIDKTSSDKFPSGRVDASKFVGNYNDVENPRIIQRGRPKAFNLVDVADVFGEGCNTPTYSTNSNENNSDKISSAWLDLRSSITNSTTSTATVSSDFDYDSGNDW
jgi:hypothetical protein